MSWEGHWITLHNWTNGTKARLFVPRSGIVSRAQERRIRLRLAPPGSPCAGGELGEDGAQLPPQTPDWEYTATRRADGLVTLSAANFKQEDS